MCAIHALKTKNKKTVVCTDLFQGSAKPFVFFVVMQR